MSQLGNTPLEIFEAEMPTYKKAMREQYETALNVYNQDNDIIKKHF
jgi:hypothetical protein